MSILEELAFYIGMPVVRTVAHSVYGHVITKFTQMGRLPNFLSYGAPPTRDASRCEWSSATATKEPKIYLPRFGWCLENWERLESITVQLNSVSDPQ